MNTSHLLDIIQNIKKYVFPLLILAGYVSLYIYLKDRFLFTPDFSKTDIFHYTTSYQHYIWKSIRSGFIPFWTDLLDGGFPLIGESALGLTYVPYYLIYPFFSSFSHASAFIFCFHLLLLTGGMYYLLLELKTARLLAFILSISFAWNGAVSFRWVHAIVLQTFSYTPLLFLLYFKWRRSYNPLLLIALSFVVHLLIVSGFVQIAFISLLGLILLYCIQEYPINTRFFFQFALSIFVGALLSFPQILPSLELSSFANRMSNRGYEFSTSVPFAIKNMCAFYSYSCLGNAKYTSYSSQWQTDGVFWENTPYSGELFIIALFLSTVIFLFTRQNKKKTLVFILLFTLFLALALGKNSPLYFVFSIMPFSIFRTPPRYLLMSVFFLILYGSLIFNYLITRYSKYALILYSVLVVNCLFLIAAPFRYHVFLPANEVYNSLSNRSRSIKNGETYITLGSQEVWHKAYSTLGWNTKESIASYLFINQSLMPSSNLIFGTRVFDGFFTLPMRRHEYIKTSITDKIKSASNSAQTEQLLDLYNISTILSFEPLSLPNFNQTNVLSSMKMRLRSYTSSHRAKPYYIPKNVYRIDTIEQLESIVQAKEISERIAYVESIPQPSILDQSLTSVRIAANTDMYMKGTISSSKKTYIILKKNWYPSWQLTVDGKKSPLYKSNIIHIGFFVERGMHTFELTYIPLTFILGSVISGATLIVIFFYGLKQIKRSF